MPPREWTFRILDMIDRIERIGGYVEGLTEPQFRENTLVIDAVIRNLEVIGEAASRLPVEVLEAYPDIPWHEMRGMRNLLIHEYFGLSLPIVWRTVTHDLPPLLAVLRPMVSESGTNAGP